MGDALAGALLLLGTFKQEFLYMTGGQALGQVVKGSVLLPLVTTTVGLAAFPIAFNEGGAHEVRVHRDLTDDGGFALAQGQSGSAAGREYPSHTYGQDSDPAHEGNKKESAITQDPFANLPKWLNG